MYVNQIAAELGYARPVVSTSLAALLSDGLVSRTPSGSYFYYELTPTGRVAADRAAETVAAEDAQRPTPMRKKIPAKYLDVVGVVIEDYVKHGKTMNEIAFGRWLFDPKLVRDILLLSDVELRRFGKPNSLARPKQAD